MTQRQGRDDSVWPGIQGALLHLANRELDTPEVARAFHEVVGRLRAGTDAEKRLADALVRRFNYPGSLSAVDAVHRIQLALQTADGRKAAGLGRRGRGPTYDSRKITLDTIPFAIALEHARRRLTRHEALDELMRYFGDLMDVGTAGRLLDEAIPRAMQFVASIDACLEPEQKSKN